MAALKIADRGYVMERGRIVLEGSAAELMANDRVKQAYLGKPEDKLKMKQAALRQRGHGSGRLPCRRQRGSRLSRHTQHRDTGEPGQDGTSTSSGPPMRRWPWRWRWGPRTAGSGPWPS